MRTYVVTGEVVNVGLAQHGVVLELTLAERRGVSGDDDKLGFARSEGLEGRFVSEGDCEKAISILVWKKWRNEEIFTFTRLHHKRQTRVDTVGCLLGFLGCWCHRCVCVLRIRSDLNCGGR